MEYEKTDEFELKKAIYAAYDAVKDIDYEDEDGTFSDSLAVISEALNMSLQYVREYMEDEDD